MIVLFNRVIKFALNNFTRNIWLSLVTISIVVLTLISVSFLAFLQVLTAEAVGTIKERVDISVYFKPEVTPQEVKAVREKLSQFEEIKTVEYISREDSHARLQAIYKDDVLISESLQELGFNPLGDTLVIKTYELASYPLILDALERSQYKGLIEDKNYQDNQLFLNKIHNVTDKIRKIGWIISGVFAAIAVLIVFNTIRIAIYTHSEEINIMRLVGASNWFIRAPFLVEAIFYAVIGTVLTLIILYPMLRVIDPYIVSFFEGSFSIVAYYFSNIFIFAWYQFVGIVALTIIASFFAVGRYLDV